MASAPDPAAPADAPAPRRRRVLVTHGLAASVAVLALSVQAGQVGVPDEGVSDAATSSLTADPAPADDDGRTRDA